MDEATKKPLITVAIVVVAFVLYILIFGLIGEIRRMPDDEEIEREEDSFPGEVLEA